MRKSVSFILAVVMTLVVGFNAFAQETTGNIEVTIKDANGAVVPNVPLTVTSTGSSTGFKRSVTSDDSGFARILLVPPGAYNITAAAVSGFAQKIVGPIEVNLGRTTGVTIELAISVGAT